MLFSAARYAFAAYIPALGIQIQLVLSLSDGSTRYLTVNPNTNALITTSSQASATTFTFDPLTDFLYYPSSRFASGYAIPAFPYSAANIGANANGAVSLVDEANVLGVGNGLFGLSTTLSVAALVTGQLLRIPILNTLAGTGYTGLGLCATSGANLIAYDSVAFSLTTGCGASSLAVTGLQVYIVSLSGTPPSSSAGVGGGIPPASSAGSCSVTVVMKLTEVTTYATSGAVLPSTTSPAPGPTVPDIFGCSPITSTFLQQVSLYL